jgi:hypothetical protein
VKRKILIISMLSVAHFIISLSLSFLVYVSMLGSFLGAQPDLSDRIIARSLMVLLFPVRNLANVFVTHPDSWLREPSGLFLIASASILWGIGIYYAIARVAAMRHNKALQLTAR